MKSVTEFPNLTLSKALQTKTSLLSEGKTPEEVQAHLGESFKLEGEKLKHFIHALEVAGQNPEKLKRVLVLTYGEGEAVPSQATKFDEHYYLPEYLLEARSASSSSDRGGKSGGRRGGPRRGANREKGGGSPWGLSPEEKAAKAKAGVKPGAKPETKPS
ncbi:MAG: hypothetical protein C5B49_01790 [Bdellovibrio sp.]|nr:MAG: hypothetical protein C5B49_01790 [Bdellovibrio sp.]